MAKAKVKSKSKSKSRSRSKTKVKVKSKPKKTLKSKTKVAVKTKTKVKPKANTVKKKFNPKVKDVQKTKIDYSKAITPLGDRLVVRVENLAGGEKVTAGGIIIPQSANTVAGYTRATVLAVGQGAKNKKGTLKPLDVKIGDTVLFSEYVGTKVSFNSEELFIVHESDVMGILQK